MQARVIGMSALLTTTMPVMKEVVDLLKKENLCGRIKTIIGGAPVSQRLRRRDRRRRLRLRLRPGGRAASSTWPRLFHEGKPHGQDRPPATCCWPTAPSARCSWSAAWPRGRLRKASTCPSPQLLEEIAGLYLEAGAEIIQTNTFGASPLKLAHYGLADKAAAINEGAVAAVRRAVGERAWVAASCGPSGRILKPYGDTEAEQVYESFP